MELLDLVVQDLVDDLSFGLLPVQLCDAHGAPVEHRLWLDYIVVWPFLQENRLFFVEQQFVVDYIGFQMRDLLLDID